MPLNFNTLAQIFAPEELAARETRESNKIRNRLAAMQLADLERKVGQESALRESYTAGFRPPQAQIGTPPTPENTNVNMLASYTGGSPQTIDTYRPMQTEAPAYLPARPGGMDYGAVQNALAASGHGEMIPDVQKQQQEQIANHVKMAESLEAMNPGKGVAYWNQNLSDVFGPIQTMKTAQGLNIHGNEQVGYFNVFKDANGQVKSEQVIPGSGMNKNMTEEQLTALALKGDKEAQAILDNMQKRKIETNKAISGGAMQLTPETLQALGERFNITGEIPGMGMGKAATEARTRVLNKWAADLNRSGTTVADQTARQAAYKASRNELSKLQSQRGTVMAFANTAEKNLALVADLSNKVDRTGAPVINRWLLAGKRSVTGDPDVAKFEAAVRTAINEYAKVTSSATGGGVTSDQARREVESMLNTAQTKEQVQQVIQLLRTEMGNRKAGYDEQINLIKRSIAGNEGGSPASEGKNKPLPSNAKVVNGITYYNVNGKWYQE